MCLNVQWLACHHVRVRGQLYGAGFFFFYLYMGSRDQTVISPSHQSLLGGSSFQFIHLKMPRRASGWQAPHLRDKLLVLGIALHWAELLCQVSTGISPTCPLFI